MIDLATRVLFDGSGTVVTLFTTDDGLILQASNEMGTTSVKVSEAEAWDAFMHPFCSEDRLDYPGFHKARPDVANTAAALIAHADDMAELESE